MYLQLAISILSGCFLGLAWLAPNTLTATGSTILAASFLIYLANSQKLSWKLGLVIGVTSHLIACNWLIDTITNFGGYPRYLSGLLFIGLCFWQALPFAVFAMFTRCKFDWLRSHSLLAPCAWAVASQSIFLLFPWDWAHTLVPLKFTQTAAIAGASLPTFIFLYFLSTWINLSALKSSRVIASFLLLAGSAYGYFVPLSDGEKINIRVVQANIDLFEKHNPNNYVRHLREHNNLSQFHKPTDLIIWPESAVMHLLNEPLISQSVPRLTPPIPENTFFLFGGLTEKNNLLYNAAIATGAGKVLTPYHKQVLMPFGEYMPFASIFPSLKKLNPVMPDFGAGTSTGIMEFKNIKLAPLICYEDLLPKLSLRAVEDGANLLVNLTNDAWFGKTAAPYQHNVIAAFRAIENGRYLIRSTNTGLTTVIDPTGQIKADLPIYEPAALNSQVILLHDKTPYSAYIGEKPWIILAVLFWLSFCFKLFYNRYEKNSHF